MTTGDPFLLKTLGEERLEELRRDAAIERAMARAMPRWRRLAASALLRAGLRVLRHPEPRVVLERAGLACRHAPAAD
ncbi:MAG TPA: hypothetical protein VFC53_03450 [Dehalococcoidia bacterium]|nr:hypothetical protein [Dehalococcoidia bacterium]